MRLYVDPQIAGELPYDGNLNVAAGAPAWWGSNNPEGVPGAGAILKSTLILDRALEPDEVAALAAQGP